MIDPALTRIGLEHVFSSFAVINIDAARAFYRDTLGLSVDSDDEMGVLTISLPGGGEVIVYPKADHVPAVFTILNLEVADIDVAVDELTRRGVTFLRYDAFDQDEKGISRHGEPQIAWFADPDGNILSVLH